MIQLNLLPDLKKEFIKSQKTKGVVISASVLVTIATLGLSALLFVYVTFLQQVQINLATDDINNKEKQLKAIPDINKYLTVQSQLAALPDLHNNKGSYAQLFDFLGVVNPSAPNNVSLSNLQLSTTDQTISMSGTTASFETLNIFVDTLKNADITYKINGQGDDHKENMFSQVLVLSSGFSHVGSKDVVSFAIKVVYNPNDFAVQNGAVIGSIPNITTTQSVTQSPSQQIFNDNKGQ